VSSNRTTKHPPHHTPPTTNQPHTGALTLEATTLVPAPATDNHVFAAVPTGNLFSCPRLAPTAAPVRGAVDRVITTTLCLPPLVRIPYSRHIGVVQGWLAPGVDERGMALPRTRLGVRVALTSFLPLTHTPNRDEAGGAVRLMQGDDRVGTQPSGVPDDKRTRRRSERGTARITPRPPSRGAWYLDRVKGGAPFETDFEFFEELTNLKTDFSPFHLHVSPQVEIPFSFLVLDYHHGATPQPPSRGAVYRDRVKGGEGLTSVNEEMLPWPSKTAFSPFQRLLEQASPSKVRQCESQLRCPRGRHLKTRERAIYTYLLPGNNANPKPPLDLRSTVTRNLRFLRLSKGAGCQKKEKGGGTMARTSRLGKAEALILQILFPGSRAPQSWGVGGFESFLSSPVGVAS